MKHILIIFLCLLLSSTTQAQDSKNTNSYPEYYADYMKQAAAAFAKGDFTTAVDKYSSALAICPQNVAIVKPKMIEVFNKINQLKKDAEIAKQTAIAEKEKAKKAQEATQTALAETEKQKQLATQNLTKANKLVNAFYFAYDRFALAFKDRKFYFIDKNGDEVTKLGKWDKAEQFDNRTGFAYIKKDGKDHILDTLGNTYRVAYDLASMDSSVVALDLSDVQLDSFPTPVLQHRQLQVLILNGDNGNADKNFKILPTEIAKLQNLKNLQLRSCNIDSLAPQIGELKNLTTLDLEGNKLTSLPAQIGELKNLTTLYLSANQLMFLPAQIGELKNLTTLNLYVNKLTPLPAQIGELKNLTTLDLAYNQLTSLPAQIGELKNLTTLDLSSNQLSSLPAQIGELKDLTTLNLWYNQLISLPTQIGELKNLTTLHLSSNKLTFLPAQIGELKNLTTLYLSSNQLTSLPAQIGELKNLTSLDLSSNQLTSLPAQIGELKNLTSLDLRSNDSLNWQQVTKQLPQGTKKVQFTINYQEAQEGILWVYIDVKQLFEVLKYATSEQVSKITTLDLTNNQLTSLPAQIGELKNLTYLNLQNNIISETEQEKTKKLLPNCEIEFSNIEEIAYHELVEKAAKNKNLAFAKEIYKGIKDKKELPNTSYGGLSWWFIFAHCFEGAIWAGERYVASGEKEIAYFSNLAMGYLYNGDHEKAKAIYAQYKNEKDSKGKTGKEIFLGDLRAVAEAKVPAKKPADVEKMIRFLEE